MIEDIKSTSIGGENCVLVGVIRPEVGEELTTEYLEELEFLGKTLEINTKKVFTQKLKKADPKTYVGSGKLNEIKDHVVDQKIKYVLFDDELSPSQVKNLEKVLNPARVVDRALLILDIFHERASTSRAKTQVEMARYQYILPRLTRMWTHLERQRGGTGTRGGAGEKELETDKRIVRDKITLLKNKLEKIDKQMQVQRKSRSGIVRVTLVGYTNVGKSTIMNLLSKSNVKAENKLFATLDSTVRKMNWEGIPFLLTDTVGFIRKLPHTLVESFKSTLDEIREADVLIHVIDISNKNCESHINTVKETLAEIQAADKPILSVFNKIDQIQSSDETVFNGTALEPNQGGIDLKKTYFNEEKRSVFISAHKKENIQELRDTLLDLIKNEHFKRYPHYLNTEGK